MSIKTAKELAVAAKKAATDHKTLYILGCFGAPMNAGNKDYYSGNYAYNRRTERTAKIQAATHNTFGFDCVCLVKGLLWGWNGDTSHPHGGAEYQSNGVPDIDEGSMINACSDVSTDFSHIQIGEVVWMKGHIGIYIGDGLAVECTHRWADGVQITAVHNIGTKSGYNGRSWTKHGKLPYVTYEEEAEENAKPDYTLGMRYLRKGCRGEDVRALQILLIGYGFSCGKWGADGDFGNGTDKAVRGFQEKNDLTVDGIVGADTMGALMGEGKWKA